MTAKEIVDELFWFMALAPLFLLGVGSAAAAVKSMWKGEK